MLPSYPRWLVLPFGIAAALWSASARAYSYGTVATDPCHEDVSAAALRQIRIDLPNVVPIAPSADEKAMVEDLQFDVRSDMRDAAGATLLAAVRDNDLKGRSPLDIEQLGAIHGAPNWQAEHCLRGPDHDEPDGSERALVACRQFIKNSVLDALNGLDADGNVDPAIRLELAINLSIRGAVSMALPRFYVSMGRALHTLQDGFTHTWRTSDRLRVTVVLNWIDETENRLVESRDGPPHAAELDRCDDPDEIRRLNRELATRASIELFRAALEPTHSREQKEQAIDEVLERYLTHEPGCSAANRWCDAPERAYADAEQGCLCRAAGSRGKGSPAVLLTLLVLGAAVSRRVGFRWRWRSLAPLVIFAPNVAQALPLAEQGAGEDLEGKGVVEEASPGESTHTPTKKNDKGDKVVSVGDGESPVLVVPKDDARLESSSRFGGQVFGGVSYDNAAGVIGGGARYQFATQWLVGLDGEWNPFYQTHRKRFTDGTANVYFTLVRRWRMRFERTILRTTLNLGASYLLYDLVGAPAGSIGPFIGLSFLGLEWKATRNLSFIFEPTTIAVPIPQVQGAPFGYPQYRFTIAVQVGA
jgi:hypothetical protein